MKQNTLDQLLLDRAQKKPVVLATNMTTGDERLIYPTSDNTDPLNEAAAIALRDDKSSVQETDDGPVFLHAYNPPLRLIIVGAVHIAQPLSQMATTNGFDVTVVDPRGGFLSPERFPGVNVIPEWPDDALIKVGVDHRTAIATLTHDPKIDDPALHIALRSPAFYIGCLGSNRTHAKRVERLGEDGLSTAEIARIHGPIGLDIGAKSPSEIAISILAQITQALRRGDTL